MRPSASLPVYTVHAGHVAHHDLPLCVLDQQEEVSARISYRSALKQVDVEARL